VQRKIAPFSWHELPVDQAVEDRGAIDPGQGRLQQRIDRDASDRTAVDGQRLHHTLSGGIETLNASHTKLVSTTCGSKAGVCEIVWYWGTFLVFCNTIGDKKVKFLGKMDDHLK
jgi:hypothetical protein